MGGAWVIRGHNKHLWTSLKLRDKPDVHMRAGDVLFVPSGLAHTVETRESSSQHITFGVHVSRQVTLLSTLLDQFAAGEEELRRPIRGDEEVSRQQLAEWAGRFERWLGRGR